MYQPQQAKPETRNPKTETRNPKPETRNTKPETRNLKPQPQQAERNVAFSAYLAARLSTLGFRAAFRPLASHPTPLQVQKKALPSTNV